MKRLTRVNKSLLLLAKIEGKQFPNNQAVLLNKIVRQSVNDLYEIAEFKNIRISVEETAELSVQMDFSLANIVISNLLRNAIFHTASDGVVNIDISENTLNVNNTGESRPLNPEIIFTRFYKSEANRNGIGLGLAIVKAICDLYDFGISYRFEDNEHRFDIRFNNS